MGLPAQVQGLDAQSIAGQDQLLLGIVVSSEDKHAPQLKQDGKSPLC